MKKSFILGITLGIIVCIILTVWINQDAENLETAIYVVEQGIECVE